VNCPECDRPLFQYDVDIMACKGGHKWRVNENARAPLTPATAERAPVRGMPAWVPGAVLGGVAVVVELVRLIF
jgi:hypothetical protein